MVNVLQPSSGALLSDLCSNPVLAGQQALSSKQVHRYHPGRRAAVASSKVPRIAHGECRTLQRLLEAKNVSVIEDDCPNRTLLRKTFVWRYVWQYHA